MVGEDVAAGGFLAAQHVFFEQPLGRVECVGTEELHGTLLLLSRHNFVYHAVLVVGLVRFEDAAQVAGDVPQVAIPLRHDFAIELIELLVGLALAVRPVDQVRHDALQVGNAEFAGFHVVIAEGLALRARVGTQRVRTAKEVLGLTGALTNPLVEHSLFCIRRVILRQRRVAPLHRPDVVRSHFGVEAIYAIAGLRNVVKARIVHNGRCRAILGRVGGRTERVNRHRMRGAPVVRKPQRVSDLVGGYKTDELAHHIVLKVDGARIGVGRRSLNEVPVAQQVRHVVVPADVALQDLAAAWIMHVRTVGVRNLGREVPNHRVADVFRTVLRVFLFGGCISGDDRILEARCFKGHLPVLHALLQILAVALGRRAVDVKDNRLHRLYQFAVGVRLGIRRLQAPACNVAALHRTMLVASVVDLLHIEVAHPFVAEAGLHGLFGQEHHGVVHLDRDRVG